jgi:predicted GIY-YIG superfamily endonuclease
MATECPFCENEYEKVASHLHYSHTKEEYKSVLIEELQRLADEHDRTPSKRLMGSKGKFGTDTYFNIFSSWNEAVKEAGLEVNKENNISKNRLLDELQRLADEYDKTPSAFLMNSEGKFDNKTYQRVFGSWNKAVKKAGLEVNEERNISKNRLLDELQRLADEYDKTPSASLMASKGKFSINIYQRVFGSWNNALKEAELELNNSSMSGMEQAVYVLECENNKHYVGASAYPDKRLREHKNRGRDASSWTREHGVKERIYLSEPMPHEEAYQKEREKTLEMMRKHGWENVRGSQWYSVELESPPEPLK